jgi:hypothetical protein
VLFLHPSRSARRDGGVSRSNQSCARIGAIVVEGGRDESCSRRLNRNRASRSLCLALIAIVALGIQPANADSSALPSRELPPNTFRNSAGSASQDPTGFVSQNVCGGDLGMLQQAEDEINDILRVNGSKIYHCTKL